jgi:glycine betaine/proline transport system ATP-binding protein
VKAHSIMEPLSSHTGSLEGAPRADHGATSIN